MNPPVFNPLWPDEVKAIFKHDVQEIWDPTVARHIWNQYHNQIRIYTGLARGDRGLDVLDIGCAQGTLALLLAELGHRVWALDIRQHFLDYAASRYEKGQLRFICGNAMEVDFSERFDLIFANQIIEHLIYPLEFTKRVAGWLKPGGRVVMTTPNADYIKNDLPTFTELGDPTIHEGRQFTADGDGHFFAYRAAELREVFEQSGLKNVSVRYFETPFISGHLKIRYLHSFVPAGVLGSFDRLTLLLPGVAGRLAHQLMVIGYQPHATVAT
jgi:2-polyprenyl-3-methyl-5-hydroxy-6-metoxy-1,4-benzoquinol methylase